MCPAVYKTAKALVGIASVYQDDMRSLFVILAHHVVGEKRLAAARRPEDELVAVGGYAPFHRLVGYVEVDRFAGEPVHHLYSEWRKAAAVVCLGGEETGRRLDKGIKTFLGGEIPLIAGYRRPEQCRAVDGVVPRHTPHHGELAADIVFHTAQFFRVIAPCHHVEMRPDRCEAVTMGLVQIAVYPLLVYGVGAAVT